MIGKKAALPFSIISVIRYILLKLFPSSVISVFRHIGHGPGELGVCRQVLKSDGFRFAFLCSFFSYPILFNDPFEVSRHPDSDRG